MMILKSPWEIDLMRKSSRIVAETLEKLVRLVEPGLSTLELDRFAEPISYGEGANRRSRVIVVILTRSAYP